MFEALLSAITFPGLRALGPSDQELVERFRGGDRRAFDEIVLRYRDRVYTLCLRWLDDADGAEEIAQDVWIALFRSLASFRGESQLSTWIFKVTINHCKNRRSYRRRRGWGRTESLGPVAEDEDMPERQIADEDARTDIGVHSREAEQLVGAALAALDEDHRQVLLLRDVEDLAYEEIAEVLDLPRGTVKSRIHRARAELAAVLAKRVRPQDVL
jgi:RNA polymerase sigma-70 factor (ECF subfamily)